jgi:hypothetical protein
VLLTLISISNTLFSQMITRASPSLANFAPLATLWTNKNIPSHKVEDALGLLWYSDLESLPRCDLLDVMSHAKTKTMGMSLTNILQLLTRLESIRHRITAPRDLLDEISAILRLSDTNISSTDFIRSLELLSWQLGPLWDPTEFLSSKACRGLVGVSSTEGMVKMARLGLGKLDGFEECTMAKLETFSPVQRSKLALYCGVVDYLPKLTEVRSVNPIVNAVNFFAAWGDSTERDVWMIELRRKLRAMSAVDSQQSLLSLLSLGEDPQDQLLKTLFESAKDAPWCSMQAKHVCYSRMDSENQSSAHIKIPQLAASRKISAARYLAASLRELNLPFERDATDGLFTVDFHVNGTPLLIQTVPWEYFHRIFFSFLPGNTIVLDSTRVHDSQYICQTRL